MHLAPLTIVRHPAPSTQHPAPSTNIQHPVRIFTIMTKKLSQIAFEFLPPEMEEEVNEPVKDAIAETNIEGRKEVAPAIEEQKQEEDQPIKKTGSKRGRMSLKEIDINADLIQIPPDEVLFQKQYYSIGEVAKWFRVNQSLVRYWETEFDILQPRKNRKGDRFFRPVDVKNLLLIHDLLRRRKFTIEGAKDYLKKNKGAEEKYAMIRSLEQIRSFFLELKASL
jgi:DNA-binding transcriptional MerR regulator